MEGLVGRSNRQENALRFFFKLWHSSPRGNSVPDWRIFDLVGHVNSSGLLYQRKTTRANLFLNNYSCRPFIRKLGGAHLPGISRPPGTFCRAVSFPECFRGGRVRGGSNRGGAFS